MPGPGWIKLRIQTAGENAHALAAGCVLPALCFVWPQDRSVAIVTPDRQFDRPHLVADMLQLAQPDQIRRPVTIRGDMTYKGVGAAEAGDRRDRYSCLFRGHYQDVLTYARRRVDVDQAQEVVAEVFLTAWRRFDDVPDPPLPWLYRVAANEIANHTRKRWRENQAAAQARQRARPRPDAQRPRKSAPRRPCDDRPPCP